MSSIVLLEDHPIIRDGLRYMLEHEGHRIEAEFSDPDDLFLQIDGLQSDILITDLDFANYKGAAVLEHEAAITQRFRTIVLSMHITPNIVRKAMDQGIAAYLSKGNGGQELLCAIRAVEQGTHYFCNDAHKAAETQSPPVTQREREVLAMLISGMSPKEIARKLGISDKTVYVHRISLLGKFRARTVFDLQRKTNELGL